MLMVYMMMQTQFNSKVGKKSHSGSLSIEIHKQKNVTKIHEDFLIKKQKNAPRYNNYLYIKSLLLGHWYEIMALYYVKSILTEISASRQDRKVLQKKQNHQIQISEHIGHATDV